MAHITIVNTALRKSVLDMPTDNITRLACLCYQFLGLANNGQLGRISGRLGIERDERPNRLAKKVALAYLVRQELASRVIRETINRLFNHG